MQQTLLLHSRCLRTLLTGHGIRVRTANRRLEALNEWCEWVRDHDGDTIIISKACWIDVTEWSLEHVKQWLGH